MRFAKIVAVSLGLLALASCRGRLVLDPSPQAAEAGDFTLAVSACEAMPGRGADICRVTAGTKISSVWRVIFPWGDHIRGGELVAHFRDVTKTYAVKGQALEIPFSDFYGHDIWDSSDDGEILLVGKLRYFDGTSERQWWARGIALVIVTLPEYSVLPIDSGYAGMKTRCKIQYTTAARSAIKCW